LIILIIWVNDKIRDSKLFIVLSNDDIQLSLSLLSNQNYMWQNLLLFLNSLNLFNTNKFNFSSIDFRKSTTKYKEFVSFAFRFDYRLNFGFTSASVISLSDNNMINWTLSCNFFSLIASKHSDSMNSVIFSFWTNPLNFLFESYIIKLLC